METTVDFAPRSRLLAWYLGGLNFQVEHHLFSRVCHIHYPALAPIVKQTAREHGLPYHHNGTFLQAVGSHARTLYRLLMQRRSVFF